MKSGFGGGGNFGSTLGFFCRGSHTVQGNCFVLSFIYFRMCPDTSLPPGPPSQVQGLTYACECLSPCPLFAELSFTNFSFTFPCFSFQLLIFFYLFCLFVEGWGGGARKPLFGTRFVLPDRDKILLSRLLVMVFRLDGCYFTLRTYGVNQLFRFVEGILVT